MVRVRRGQPTCHRWGHRGIRQAVDAFVVQLAAHPENVAAGAKSEADRRFLSEGYGEWFASFLRAAGISGSHGAADDYLASFRAWGFSLGDISEVTIWQGTEDQNVPPFHSEWLREHLPQARLRLLENEGHVSIVGHMPEIINTLLANSR